MPPLHTNPNKKKKNSESNKIFTDKKLKNKILQTCDEKDNIISDVLDLDEVDKVRTAISVSTQKRSEVYKVQG